MKRLWLFPVLAILHVGCSSDSVDTPSVPEGSVYLDNFADGVNFEFFAGSASEEGVLTQVIDEKHDGTTALRIAVPASGWVGGTFKTATGIDLSAFTAVTFWAKASQAATLDTAGLGVDNVDPETPYLAEWKGIPLTTSWTKYVIPIPDASKLVAAGGLFHFAEGSDEGAYALWLDDIRYETLGTDVLGTPTAAISTATVLGEVAATWHVGGTTVTYPMTGTSQVIEAAPRYFEFASSDEGVATVDAAGAVTAVGVGEAEVTATLGGVAADGVLTVQVVDQVGPQGPAPTPTAPAAQVISLFSDAYTNVPVDTWSADWPDMADVADDTIGSDNVKKYTSLVYAGIEFKTPTVDASGMTHFHLDVWTPDATALSVKLVDFGADGAFDGGDDTEATVTFDAASTPALVGGSWVSLDVPLSAFSGLASRSHLAQLILAVPATDTGSTMWVDNVYFHAEASSTPTEPTAAAPAPEFAVGTSVTSLFSGGYTDVTVDSWSTDWDDATVTDVDVAGDATKKYTDNGGQSWGLFIGIEATTQPIDATALTHFRFDVWTPDATTLSVKLVDAGADGTVGTGGDDSEHQLDFTGTTTPAVAQGAWTTFDLPLASFTGLTATAHIAQIIFVASDNSTLYIDNVLFHD